VSSWFDVRITGSEVVMTGLLDLNENPQILTIGLFDKPETRCTTTTAFKNSRRSYDVVCKAIANEIVDWDF
jgi:hypothetical protein